MPKSAFIYGPKHHHRSPAAHGCERREKMGKRVRLAGGRDLVILRAASCDPHAHRPGIIELALPDPLAGGTGHRRHLPGGRTRSFQGAARLGKQRRFSAMLPGVSCLFQDLE